MDYIIKEVRKYRASTFTRRKPVYYDSYISQKMNEKKKLSQNIKFRVFGGKRRNFSENTFRDSY